MYKVREGKEWNIHLNRDIEFGSKDSVRKFMKELRKDYTCEYSLILKNWHVKYRKKMRENNSYTSPISHVTSQSDELNFRFVVVDELHTGIPLIERYGVKVVFIYP